MIDHFDADALLQWRAERDEFCRTHYASPIPEDHLLAFTGLRYFDPDPAVRVRGRFAPAEGKVDIATSTGSTTGYALAGYVDLILGTEAVRVTVLHAEEDELFIPFRDATCGAGSYEGGRYAPVVISGPEEATVDFNRAVNPYCAYDEEFSCPLPPTENALPMAIRAGEMDYHPFKKPGRPL